MEIFIVNGNKISSASRSKQLTGEKVPGDLDSWDYFGTDPNDLLKLNYNILCERATTLFHTHPPVAGAIRKSNTYAIGSGLHFRSQPDWRYLGITKEKAKDWGMRFQKLVHYVFLMLNFYQKQGILFQTADIMGDSLLMFDYTDQTGGKPFDIIETGGDQIDFTASGEDRTLGIIHDKFLRRKGIVQDKSKKEVMFSDENSNQQLIQYFNKQMARQLRGFPLAYRIIAAAKNNDRWWDATLARAVLESIMMAYTSETNGDDPFQQASSLAKTVIKEDGSMPPTSSMANVMNQSVGNIYDFTGKGAIQFTDLKTPSNNFDKFQTAYIELAGMATDVPPEVLMSKYSTSFTAHKGALNDFWKFTVQKRGNFTNTVCYPTLKEVAKYLFVEGLIEMPSPDFFTNPITQMATLSGVWLGPVPGHINPLQEVKALIEAKDNAFTTPADAAAQYGGGEFEDFIEEWQRQMEEWQKMNPDKKAQVIAGQEEEINEQEEAETNNNGEVMNIKSPMGNFDFQIRKRSTKKTVNYIDIHGQKKTAEIIEEEL